MSKFNESNMKDYNIIKADNFKPCVECGEMTQYMDYIYDIKKKRADDEVGGSRGSCFYTYLGTILLNDI